MTVSNSSKAAAFAMALMVSAPAIAQSYEPGCDETTFRALEQRSLAGKEFEVRRKEASLRPLTPIRELSCLDSLLSLNVNGFSGISSWMQNLSNMVANFVCNAARQQFTQLTQPLNQQFQIPGLQYGMGGGSVGWTVGGGPNGTLSLNGSRYGAQNVMGNGWYSDSSGGFVSSPVYTSAPSAIQNRAPAPNQAPAQAAPRPAQQQPAQQRPVQTQQAPSTGSPLQGLFR